jgi:hypothetical protein
LKVTVRDEAGATPAPPSGGTVDATVGAGSLLRGLGAPTSKSARLLSVSCAPFCFRRAAVVFERLGVGAV